MSLVQSLLDYLRKKDTHEEHEVPSGMCPNCWGREEYGGHFYQRIQQQDLDINHKDSHVGWINDYANKHLVGIALKKHGNGEKLICESCNTNYQHADEHTGD